MNPPSDSISGLFPDSQAVVIGLPPKFKILEELEQANYIRLATAFGHMSGWKMLEPPIMRCKGPVDVITGLDFFQTEPDLLRAWKRASDNPRFRARLITSGPGIFHPKVLIVSSPSRSFALVGSGNLSEGGLRKNIECTVYTDDEVHFRHLVDWFDGLFNRGKDFDEDFIRKYEPKYNDVFNHRPPIDRQQRDLEITLVNPHSPPSRYWVIADGDRDRQKQDDQGQAENFYRDGVVRITGRKELGTLQDYRDQPAVEGALEREYPGEFQNANPPKSAESKARMCYNFGHEVAVGDGIFLRHGVHTILLYGVAQASSQSTGTKQSPYFFDAHPDWPHALKVHWEKWEKKDNLPFCPGFQLARGFIAEINGDRLDTLKAAIGLD